MSSSCLPKEIFVNYTQMYSDIYESLQSTKITHEQLHNICSRLTAAINDYYLIVNGDNPNKVIPGCKLGYPVSRKQS